MLSIDQAFCESLYLYCYIRRFQLQPSLGLDLYCSCFRLIIEIAFRQFYYNSYFLFHLKKSILLDFQWHFLHRKMSSGKFPIQLSVSEWVASGQMGLVLEKAAFPMCANNDKSEQPGIHAVQPRYLQFAMSPHVTVNCKHSDQGFGVDKKTKTKKNLKCQLKQQQTTF